jgi:hypothetical protein
MYEVIVTYRPDFRELPLGRFKTEAEARAAAQQFAVEFYGQVVRTRVRIVREVKAQG